MERDKQIEEMAKDMCEYYYEGTCYQDKKPCDCKCECFTDAQYLYAKGYRKIYDDHQRQCTCYALGCQMAEELKKKVAREIFEEIGKLTNEYLQGKIYTHEFCTNLAELKKKYTESER